MATKSKKPKKSAAKKSKRKKEERIAISLPTLVFERFSNFCDKKYMRMTWMSGQAIRDFLAKKKNEKVLPNE